MLNIDGTEQLEATTDSDAKIKWESSDKKVATVDQTGMVTAVAEGEAVITASAEKYAPGECKVIVTTGDLREELTVS